MKIIYIVIFAILVLALTVLLIQKVVRQIQEKENRIAFFVLIILSTVLFEGLFITSAFVPSFTQKKITASREILEKEIDNINPGASQKELDKESFLQFLSDAKDLKKQVLEQNQVGFLVRVIGIKKYTDSIESFVDNIDANIKDFETQGIDFNLHNILLKVQEKTIAPIMLVTKIIQIILLVIIGIVFSGIALMKATKSI